jgi:uncharacterized membrane protein (DUF4010 family)
MAVQDLATLRPLAVSLAIGMIIGLQRGWKARGEPPGHRVAGFRTFGLLGLCGGIAALLPVAFGAVLIAAAGATLVTGYLRSSSPDEHSATTTIAGILTLALGAYAATGRQTEALAGAAVMLLLLTMREQLHSFLRGISDAEIEAASRFAIVALVILPLMPDQPVGPYEAWNPRQLWTVVVIVLGLSFAGYAASRRLGPSRGLMITAAAGALVSSTAVTASYARRLREDSPAASVLIAGIAIASAVMYVRVLLLTAILAPEALASLTLAMAPAALVACAAAWLVSRREPSQSYPGELALGNPLNFGPAFSLAALVAILAVASRWLLHHFGDAGVGTLLLVTGFADVDAAVITLAGLPPGTLTPTRAGLLLSLPVLGNMALKAGMVVLIAPNGRGARGALPLVASIAAATGGIAFLALS